MDLTLISDWHGLFFVASFNAENIDLKIASAVGFESIFIVYFLILPIRFSIKLV
jgi:hypothetical protein